MGISLFNLGRRVKSWLICPKRAKGNFVQKNIATIHHFNFLEKKKLSSRLIINQAAVLRFDLWERERIANWSLQCPHGRPLLKPMGPWIHVFSHRPLIIMLLDKDTQIVKPNLTRKIVKYHQNHTIRWWGSI